MALLRSTANVSGRHASEISKPICEGLRLTTVTLVHRSFRVIGDVGSRGVLDGEDCTGRRRVAAIVRGREGHSGTARGATTVAEGCEVVGPGDTSADVGGGRSAMGVEPGIELGLVSSTVAFDCLIRGSDIDARVGFVFNGEGGTRRDTVATRILHREGHERRPGVSAIIRQGHEVMGPRNPTGVGRLRTAVVRQPSLKLSLIATSVALHRHVGGLQRNGRVHIVLYCDGRRRRAGLPLLSVTVRVTVLAPTCYSKVGFSGQVGYATGVR